MRLPFQLSPQEDIDGDTPSVAAPPNLRVLLDDSLGGTWADVQQLLNQYSGDLQHFFLAQRQNHYAGFSNNSAHGHSFGPFLARYVNNSGQETFTIIVRPQASGGQATLPSADTFKIGTDILEWPFEWITTTGNSVYADSALEQEGQPIGANGELLNPNATPGGGSANSTASNAGSFGSGVYNQPLAGLVYWEVRIDSLPDQVPPAGSYSYGVPGVKIDGDLFLIGPTNAQGFCASVWPAELNTFLEPVIGIMPGDNIDPTYLTGTKCFVPQILGTGLMPGQGQGQFETYYGYGGGGGTTVWVSDVTNPHAAVFCVPTSYKTSTPSYQFWQDTSWDVLLTEQFLTSPAGTKLNYCTGYYGFGTDNPLLPPPSPLVAAGGSYYASDIGLYWCIAGNDAVVTTASVALGSPPPDAYQLNGVIGAPSDLDSGTPVSRVWVDQTATTPTMGLDDEFFVYPAESVGNAFFVACAEVGGDVALGNIQYIYFGPPEYSERPYYYLLNYGPFDGELTNGILQKTPGSWQPNTYLNVATCYGDAAGPVSSALTNALPEAAFPICKGSLSTGGTWIFQTPFTAGDTTSQAAVAGDLGQPTIGDIVQIAVDVTTGAVWFGKNGQWFNDAQPGDKNPTTYLDMTPMPDGSNPKHYAAVGYRVGSCWTMMLLGSAQTYPAPAGFTPLGPPDINVSMSD